MEGCQGWWGCHLGKGCQLDRGCQMNRKLTLMKNIRILAAAELRPNVRELSFAFFKKNDTYKRKPLDIDQKFVYIDPVIRN